ncbi:hypothetical protein GGI64_004061 [Rhizobium leguminosarum]|uniref:Uncharacterized protein n=2 Tax=Rhizobium leguminosarum TaxID=384 RepID=J0HCP6_RHILT|nr:hypothetical protein [Rhizobium leguminosarum]EJB08213.1 hypothetical protein Rleg9DRAFT_7250 [Rhizobium leguminosarum bv. trifolii WSM597]NYJ12980.1 hypothetical protein [Rhizobium leguminosarum]
MQVPKTAFRSAPLLLAAVVTGILFGNPIFAFLAREGAIIADLRLMQAQANLAVLRHATGADQHRAETDSAPLAPSVSQ